jgi:hypothetical protein
MTAAIAQSCIGEPISWLRLERYALERTDAGVSEHVAACPACRACLDEISADIVALPPLAVPAPKRRWWKLALPIGGALAAAAILLLLLRPKAPAVDSDMNIKGLGDVIVDVVRERGGVVRQDVRTFAPGDRWKVIVTCAQAGRATIDVDVDGDHPLPPAELACGNRIVLPGAFMLTGTGEQRVCVRVASEGDAGTSCLTLTPE